MKKLLAAVTLAAALIPGTAVAASGYLHMSEARSMQSRLATRMQKRLIANDMTKGACKRIDSRHVNCPVTYHRYLDSVLETCHYKVRVDKRRVSNGTETHGFIDGYCGQED